MQMFLQFATVVLWRLLKLQPLKLSNRPLRGATLLHLQAEWRHTMPSVMNVMTSDIYILWEKRSERSKERCREEEIVLDVSLAVVPRLKTELLLHEACHYGKASWFMMFSYMCSLVWKPKALRRCWSRGWALLDLLPSKFKREREEICQVCIWFTFLLHSFRPSLKLSKWSA